MEVVSLKETGKRMILILNADRMFIVITGHAFQPLVRDHSRKTLELYDSQI